MMSNITLFPPRKPLFSIAAGLFALLAACSNDTPPPPPVKLLATDIHLTIGGERLTLPFAALEDYAYRGVSFSLNRDRDRMRAKEAVEHLIQNATDPDTPLAFRDLAVVVRAYGSNAADLRRGEMCPLLTRAWARSVCDNPWAPIRQALPGDRFRLVDLGGLSKKEADRLFNCVEGNEPLNPIPQASEQVAIVCRAVVYPLSGRHFHTALVRIQGDLGAIWTVGPSQYGESTDAMAQREGKALVLFVKNAPGSTENFPALQAEMCHLRRPGPADPPRDPDCPASKLDTN